LERTHARNQDVEAGLIGENGTFADSVELHRYRQPDLLKYPPTNL
jgi:hypothetical protein